MSIVTRTILKADNNKILTNGETYGAIVYLSDTDSPDNWHEITDAEYQQILAQSVEE